MSNLIASSNIVKKLEAKQRIVKVNDNIYSTAANYNDNAISTTKYNAFLFFPISLFLQFTKYSNIFYLALSIIQSISIISPISNVSSLYPLIFVVLVSIFREGYEEFKRWQQDIKTNETFTNLYSKDHLKFLQAQWSELKVGDLVKVRKGDTIPADLFLLSSSDEDGGCYLITASLDGERNLKKKSVLPEINTFMQYKKGDYNFKGEIECDLPNKNLNSFKGKVQFGSFNKMFVKIDNFLWRGAILSNTQEVVGVVIYAGMESKIMLNQGSPIFKETKMDKNLNIIVAINLLLLLISVIILAALQTVNRNNTHDASKKTYYSYIFYNESVNSTALSFFQSFFYYIVLLSTFVPISVMVSLEVIKFLQAVFINEDVLLYNPDPESKSYANCVCMTLNEELANINIIFSDKTGTLTSNVMEFKACSIGHKLYENKEIESKDDNRMVNSMQLNKKNTMIPTKTRQPPNKSIKPDNKKQQEIERYLWTFNLNELKEDFNSDIKNEEEKVKEKEEKQEEKKSKNTSKDEEKRLPMFQRIGHFWKCIILCNDIIPIAEDGGIIKFQGPSSDEITLVDAAQKFKFELLKKRLNIQEVRISNKDFCYTTRLNLAFNSDKKCQTVVVEDQNHKIFVYIKGADSSLEKRYNGNSKENESYEKTKKHLKYFGRKGYRTLCMGYKEMDSNIFIKWYEDYDRLTKEINELGDNIYRSGELLKLIEELEKDIIILGATAIEDKLQDFVPEAIEDLRKANIQIWMLTGDKKETAENIGISCNLIDKDSTPIALEEIDPDQIKDKIFQIKSRGKHHNQNDEDTFSDIGINQHQKYTHLIKEIVKEIKEISLNKDQKKSPGLLVSGETFAKILEDSNLKKQFVEIIEFFSTVIVFRATPSQKSDMVELVRNNTDKITLSIGDGGNDVPMIKAAHIGVGLLGREGNQASSNADFSFGQFAMLWRLLFIHGRWNGLRISYFANFFFFKNLFYTLTQLLFAFHCYYSGQSFTDSIYLMLYNTIITAIPIAFYAILEQDLNVAPTNCDSCLENTGNLNQSSVNNFFLYFLYYVYKETRDKRLFTFGNYFVWVFRAIIYSCIAFFIPVYLLNDSIWTSSGLTLNLWAASLCSFCIVIFSQLITICLDSNNWSILSLIAYAFFGIILFMPSFVLLYDIFSYCSFSGCTQIYLGNGGFWLVLFAGIGIIIITNYLWDSLNYFLVNRFYKTMIQMNEDGSRPKDDEFAKKKILSNYNQSKENKEQEQNEGNSNNIREEREETKKLIQRQNDFSNSNFQQNLDNGVPSNLFAKSMSLKSPGVNALPQKNSQGIKDD